MRALKIWIFILLATVAGAAALTQDEGYRERLRINKPFVEPDVCTRGQAIDFYAALGDYSDLIGEIKHVSDGETSIALASSLFRLVRISRTRLLRRDQPGHIPQAPFAYHIALSHDGARIAAVSR